MRKPRPIELIIPVVGLMEGWSPKEVFVIAMDRCLAETAASLQRIFSEIDTNDEVPNLRGFIHGLTEIKKNLENMVGCSFLEDSIGGELNYYEWPVHICRRATSAFIPVCACSAAAELANNVREAHGEIIVSNDTFLGFHSALAKFSSIPRRNRHNKAYLKEHGRFLTHLMKLCQRHGELEIVNHIERQIMQPMQTGDPEFDKTLPIHFSGVQFGKIFTKGVTVLPDANAVRTHFDNFFAMSENPEALPQAQKIYTDFLEASRLVDQETGTPLI